MNELPEPTETKAGDSNLRIYNIRRTFSNRQTSLCCYSVGVIVFNNPVDRAVGLLIYCLFMPDENDGVALLMYKRCGCPISKEGRYFLHLLALLLSLIHI